MQWIVKRSSDARMHVPPPSEFGTQSSAKFSFTSNATLLADILGTSQRPAARGFTSAGQQTTLKAQTSFASLSGASDRQQLKTEPCAATELRSAPSQAPPQGEQGQQWALKVARAEFKSNVLIQRMSMLQHVQTSLELQDLKRFPRYISKSGVQHWLACIGTNFTEKRTYCAARRPSQSQRPRNLQQLLQLPQAKCGDWFPRKLGQKNTAG